MYFDSLNTAAAGLRGPPCSGRAKPSTAGDALSAGAGGSAGGTQGPECPGPKSPEAAHVRGWVRPAAGHTWGSPVAVPGGASSASAVCGGGRRKVVARCLQSRTL